MKKMNSNIIFLINSLTSGGAEKLVINLHSKIKNSRIVIFENVIEHQVDSSDITLLESSFKQKYLSLLFLAKRLKNTIAKDDIVIASLFRSFILAYLVNVFFNRKYYCWVHNDSKKYVSNNIVKILFKYIFKNSEGIIVNSKKAKLDLENLKLADNSKVHVIYNYLDIDRIKNKLDNNPNTLERKLIKFIYVGRLHEIKGILPLVNLFIDFLRQGYKAKLDIYGRGELENQLKEKIEKHNVSEFIELKGFSKNPYPSIQSSDYLIFPSFSEGFGNVIMESLVCETPVISADIDSGPREILLSQGDIYKRTSDAEILENGILLPSLENENSEEIWIQTLISVVKDDISCKVEFKDNDYIEFSDRYILDQWNDLINKEK